MARVQTGSSAGRAPLIELSKGSGASIQAEVVEGDGLNVTLGLPGSADLEVAVGEPIGFRVLNGAADSDDRRIGVCVQAVSKREGVRTVTVGLLDRRHLNAARGSTLSALFNERAAFRLPVSTGSIRAARAIPARVQSGTKNLPGNSPRARWDAPVPVRILDVSFDGLALLASNAATESLEGIEDIRVEMGTEQGLVVVGGLIRHRIDLPRNGGVRLGVAAGASKFVPWTEAEEQQLRRFVSEQQRSALARLRAA